MRNQWKKYLLDLVASCGLCFAIASSVLGQDQKSEPRSNPSRTTQPGSRADNGTSNSNNPNSGQYPRAANGTPLFNGLPTSEASNQASGGQRYSQFPPPMNAPYLPPPYNSNSNNSNSTVTYYASPVSEFMIYEDGKFSVVNQLDEKRQDSYRNTQKTVSEALQTLRTENSSEEKRTEAKELLGNFLGAHFEHDQKKRKEQLQALEQQVVKLKSQLEKRSQSKDQLIELRLKLMENDVSGLSFPQSWNNLNGMENPPTMNYPQPNSSGFGQGSSYSQPNLYSLPPGQLP